MQQSEIAKNDLTEFAQNCTLAEVEERLDKEYVGKGKQSEDRQKAKEIELKLWKRLIDARDSGNPIPQMTAYLVGLNLEEISPTLLELGVAVEHLYIHDNNIEKLPEDFGKLSRLKTLSAGSNRLADLPKSLEECSLLEDISIADNNFSGVPECVKHMSSLGTLHLGSQKTVSEKGFKIPDWINQLKLHDLDISGCGLTQFPDLQGLRNSLLKLDIGGNHFTAPHDNLKSGIGQFSKLRELRMDHCVTSKERASEILTSEVLTSIYKLTTLGVLDFSYNYLNENHLTNIGHVNAEDHVITQHDSELLDINEIVDTFYRPLNISNLRSLKELMLNGNTLSEIPPEVCTLPQLEVLYCAGNELETIPPEISNLQKIESIDLSDNIFGGTSEGGLLDDDPLDELVNSIVDTLKTLPARCSVDLKQNEYLTLEILERIQNTIRIHAMTHPGEGPLCLHDHYEFGASAARWLSSNDSEDEVKEEDIQQFDEIGEIFVETRTEKLVGDDTSAQSRQLAAEGQRILSTAAYFLHRGSDECREQIDATHYVPQIEFRENPNVPQTRIHPSIIALVVDDFLIPIREEYEATEKVEAAAFAFGILATALGNCDNALIVGADKAAEAMRRLKADKENWSDDKRLREGLQSYLKKLPLDFMEHDLLTHGDKMETNAYLLVHLCNNHKLLAMGNDQPGEPGLRGPKWMDVHQHQFHALGKDDIQRTKKVEEFLQFAYHQKLASHTAFAQVKDRYEKIVNFFDTVTPSSETQEMLHALGECRQVIADHEKVGAQGQQLVEHLIFDDFFKPCLKQVCGDKLDQIEEEFVKKRRELVEDGDYEEWANKQTFDHDMPREEKAKATSGDAYGQVYKLAELLKEMQTIAIAMQPTQQAVKEHLFPNLQIGAELLAGKGKGMAGDSSELKRKAESSSPKGGKKKVKTGGSEEETNIVNKVWNNNPPPATNEIPSEKVIFFPLHIHENNGEKQIECAIRSAADSNAPLERRIYTPTELVKGFNWNNKFIQDRLFGGLFEEKIKINQTGDLEGNLPANPRKVRHTAPNLSHRGRGASSGRR